MDDSPLDIRFIAEDEVIDSLEQALGSRGVSGQRSKVLDPSYLGLDLSSLVDLLVVVNLTLCSDPLLPTLWEWLRPGAKKTRIVVETPAGRVVFDSREELSEEEVEAKLSALVGVIRRT